MEVWVKIFLKAIRFENFKSYIGQNEAGPGHPRLNSIIGPNGSGKSNFLDAILFVLGKRAMEIRFRNLSEIISFSRLKKYKFASATIGFRLDLFNLQGDPTGLSEIFISRKIIKKRYSGYFINGKELNLQKLSAIFSKKKILLKKNRFLIQQGEIEKVSVMKPIGKFSERIGLLEYSEEIFGTFRYVKFVNKMKKKSQMMRQEYLRIEKNSKKPIWKENEFFFKKTQTFKQIFCFINIQIMEILSISSLFNQKKKREEKSRSLIDLRILVLEKIKKFFSQLKFQEKVFYKGVFLSKKGFLKFFQFYNRNVFFLPINYLGFSNSDISGDAILNKKRKKEKQIHGIRYKIFEKFFSNEGKESENFLKIWFFDKKKSTLLLLYPFWKFEILKKKIKILQVKKFFQKIDQSFVSEKKGFFFSIICQIKREEVFISKKKKFSKEFLAFFVSTQSHKLLLENRIFIKSMRNFPFLKNGKKNDSSEKKSRLEFFQNSSKNIGKWVSENFGVIGQIGSLGFVNQVFYRSVLSALKGEFETFLIRKVSESLPLVEFFTKKKLGRVKILILEKTKFFFPSKKNHEKSRNFFDKIFTFQEIEPVFNYLLNETLLVENLSQGIQHAFDSENPKRIVTLNGEIIEKSGVFFGGKTKRSSLLFLKKFRSAFLKWTEIFQSISTKKKNLEIFKIRKWKKKQTNSSSYSINKKYPKIFFFLFIDRWVIKFYLRFRIGFHNFFFFFSRLQKLFKLNGKSKLEGSIQKKKWKLFILFDLKKRFSLGFENFLQIIFFNFSQEIFSQKKIQETKSELEIFKFASYQIIWNRRKKFYQKNQKKAQKFQNYQKAIRGLNKLSFLIINSFFIHENFLFFIFRIFEDLKYESEVKIKLLGHKLIIAKKIYKNWNEKKIRIKLEIKKNFFFFKIFKRFFGIFFFLREPQVIKKKFQGIHWEKIINPTFRKKYERGKENYFISLKEGERVLNFQNFFLLTLFKELKGIRSQKIKIFIIRKLLFKNELFFHLAEQVHSQRLSDFLQNLFLFERKAKLVYSLITTGGIIELELLNESEPFSQGILCSIKPPDKAWKTIFQLSGGEKTIGSLAMLFAFQILKPVLWYLFDEIDAALDFKNVLKISSHLIASSKSSQIFIVSLRSNMFGKGNHLIGVGKINDETRIVSLGTGFSRC